MLTNPRPGKTFTVDRGTASECVATVVEVSRTTYGLTMVSYHVPGRGFGAYLHGIDHFA